MVDIGSLFISTPFRFKCYPGAALIHPARGCGYLANSLAVPRKQALSHFPDDSDQVSNRASVFNVLCHLKNADKAESEFAADHCWVKNLDADSIKQSAGHSLVSKAEEVRRKEASLLTYYRLIVFVPTTG